MMQIEDAVEMRHAIEDLKGIRAIEIPERKAEPASLDTLESNPELSEME